MRDGMFEDGAEFMRTLSLVAEGNTVVLPNHKSVLTSDKNSCAVVIGERLSDVTFNRVYQVCDVMAKNYDLLRKDQMRCFHQILLNHMAWVEKNPTKKENVH